MHLKSLEQKILSSKEWLVVFHNMKNKQHLCGNDFVQSSKLPILVNNKNITLKKSVTKVFDGNHITAEDKYSILLKTYGGCCFDGPCLCC